MSFAKGNLAKEKKGDDNCGSVDDHSVPACSREGQEDHRSRARDRAEHGASGPGQAGAAALPAAAAAESTASAFKEAIQHMRG